MPVSLTVQRRLHVADSKKYFSKAMPIKIILPLKECVRPSRSNVSTSQ